MSQSKNDLPVSFAKTFNKFQFSDNCANSEGEFWMEMKKSWYTRTSAASRVQEK